MTLAKMPIPGPMGLATDTPPAPRFRSASLWNPFCEPLLRPSPFDGHENFLQVSGTPPASSASLWNPSCGLGKSLEPLLRARTTSSGEVSHV